MKKIILNVLLFLTVPSTGITFSASEIESNTQLPWICRDCMEEYKGI